MKKILVLFLLLLLFSTVYSLNVDLKAAPQNGTEPLTVNLWDSSTNCDEAAEKCVFEWDFEGNGIIDATTTSPTNSVTHIYSAGYYYPKLKVTNLLNKTIEAGCSNCAEGKIEVRLPGGNWPPWANPNGPYKAVAGINNIALNSTGSGDKNPGNIVQYNWVITTKTGNPNCPATVSGANPVITCNGIGTALVELTVVDDNAPVPGTDTNSTTLKTIEEQTEDLINLVKINLEPETLNKGQNDLTITVTIRNVSNQNQAFDIDFQVKDMETTNTFLTKQVLNQTVDVFGQKDFVIAITSAELAGAGLKTQENYWAYATATTTALEENKTFNSRRAVFSYNEIRTVQFPETNFIGIIIALLSALLILKKR